MSNVCVDSFMSNALHKHLEAFFHNKIKCGHINVFIVTFGDFYVIFPTIE